ncbi:MAG: prepilin peptidase [Phycisphaerales bacterium]|nr:prepilin peptidase [Phycisphaerales bacterium]
MITLWWLLFCTAVGLCLGSFLNVVIYRLPLGLDVSRPRWSFCPHCCNRIAWHHNIPVISFLRLRGRCHNCWSPIALRYPLVEIMTAMLVLVLLDAFFVGRAREGLTSAANLNWSLADDWPMYVAHVVLMTSLLAMSAIDLQFYWVDIRFTHLAAACGILLHSIWTPGYSRDWPRPFDATAAGGTIAFIVFAITWLLLPRRDASDAEMYTSAHDHARGDEMTNPDRAPQSNSVAGIPSPGFPPHVENVFDAPQPFQSTGRKPGDEDAEGDPRFQNPRAGAHGSDSVFSALGTHGQEQGNAARRRLAIPLVLFAALFVSIAAADAGASWAPPYWTRAAAALTFFMIVILREAAQVRDSDTDIAEAIEVEAPNVRVQTLRELAVLLPAIALGTVAVVAALQPGIGERIRGILHWAPLDGGWQPLWGCATAMSGYVIAAGMAWTVRILANLIYGKEAFATGDIHMMAAAGAVAGWPVVLMGFVVTCVAAMIGWLALLPFKRSRVIPLGPWLTIGLLAATVFHRQLMETPVVQELIAAVNLLFFNNSQTLTAN